MFLLINYCSGMFLLGPLQIARTFVLLLCQVATKAAQTSSLRMTNDWGWNMSQQQLITKNFVQQFGIEYYTGLL